MGRPKKVVGGEGVHVLLSRETIKALDVWVLEIQRQLPGGSGVTRADLIRDLLNKAIRDHHAAKKERRR